MTIDYSAATADPPAVTYDPSVHNVPTADTPSTTQLAVIGRATNLQTGTANGVAGALVGGLSSGADPFAALASFGQAALGAVASLASLITQLGGTIISDVGTVIIDAINGVAAVIEAVIGAFTGIFTGVGRSDIPTATNQAQTVMQATAATIAANSAALQQLQNRDAAVSNNGTNVYVNFGGYTDSPTVPDFTPSYSPSGYGTLGITSGRAVLQPSGGAAFTGLELYTSAQTQTDYQVISAVFATAPTGSARNILIGRSNASMTTYVYALVKPDGSGELHNVVSGTDTLVASWAATYGYTFFTGAAYSLVCGAENDVSTYEVRANGAPLVSWQDSSNVTNVGALYRYCGFGLVQNGGTPSQVSTFGFVDNAPAPLIGNIFRAYSSSAVVSVANSALFQQFPASFYDSVTSSSAGYSYDPATNKLTVSVAGVYMVKVGVNYEPPSSPSSNLIVNFFPGLYHNGELFEEGGSLVENTGGFSTTRGSNSKAGLFIIPLAAGDYLEPAFLSYCSSGTGEIAGDPNISIFSCALMNTGQSG